VVRNLGYTRVEVVITDPERIKSVQSVFLLDSGSWYSCIPLSLAEKIDLKTVMKTTLTLADKRKVEVNLSPAHIKVMDREVATLLALLNVPEPLLGVETLEALGLKLDPTTSKLEITRPYTTLLVYGAGSGASAQFIVRKARMSSSYAGGRQDFRTTCRSETLRIGNRLRPSY
jgi:clan AA aspartic protease